MKQKKHKIKTHWLFLFLIIISFSAKSQVTAETGLVARNGCPVFFNRLKKHEPVTIVYFGGSITNHPGYRVFSGDWFKKRYPGSEITTINAGIGGTGSDLGVFRMDDDVIKYRPDLVFVEFAVNDGGTDSVTVCRSMEGIVRKLKKNCPKTDICFLYTVNETMLKDLMQGRLYKSMRYMEQIAGHYKIPSISFAPEVVRLVKQDSLIFKGENGVGNSGKKIFSNDGTHPTLECGHLIYTKILTQSMLAMEAMNTTNPRPVLPQPLDVMNYERAKAVPVSEFRKSGGWMVVSNDDKIYQHYLGSSKVFPDLFVSDNPDDFIEIRFRGTVAGVFDVIGPGSSGFTFQVDNGEIQHICRFDSYCGSFYRSNYKLLPVLEEGDHTLIIRPDNTPFDKKAIYGSKQTVIADESYFQSYKTLIGRILLIGEVLH